MTRSGTGRQKLVLASASPRRARLLRLLDREFAITPVEVDETVGPAETAEVAVRRLAATKAAAAAMHHPESVILAADTIVVLDGRVLGKPADADEAREVLQMLRGRSHDVLTAVVLTAGDRRLFESTVRTVVEMREYADREIQRYIARGEPFDKAGGYAIQDAIFRPVRDLAGCYPNVVGLPLCEVARGLVRAGLHQPMAAHLKIGQPGCALCTSSRTLFEAAE